jgi:hypothetical protein
VKRSPWRRSDLWAFHLEVTDASGRLVWHTLAGASALSYLMQEADARAIEGAAARVRSALDDDVEKLLRSLDVSLRAHADLASRREHAIEGALHGERARLSASLLQPGLFDRRAERALAAQNAVLEEALAGCRARLDDIAATAQLDAEPGRLAFALLRR